MGRFVSACVFALALVVSSFAQGKYVTAGPQWCEEDPTFLVNGALLDVTTTFPYQYASAMKGPVAFELLVPSNVTAAVVSLPGTVPVTAKITHSLPAYWGLLAIPVVVKVTVPASASFDTQTQVTGTYLRLSSTVNGKSNVTTYVSYSLLGL
jgi:hypothetical protein